MTQTLEQFQQALADFCRSQEFDGRCILIAAHPRRHTVTTNVETAAEAATLLFDVTASLHNNFHRKR
jgi:hypothetical protein